MRLLKKEKTYKEIIYYILSENLQFGNRIPTEYELCQKFNVSRITLRAAVDRLVQENILKRDGRNGTIVQQLPSSEKSADIRQKQILFVYFSSISGGFLEAVGTAPEQIYRGIEKYINEHDDALIVQTGDNFLKTNFSMLNNVDGVIFGGKINNNAISKIVDRRIPILAIDEFQPLCNFDAISCDQFEAGYLATQAIFNRKKADKIIFLELYYSKAERLQPAYRRQLRGINEFLYQEDKKAAIEYPIFIEQCSGANLASTTDALATFIVENSIDGLVACSNNLEELLIDYSNRYKPLNTSKLPGCLVTAEAGDVEQNPFDSVYLNIQKAGYLAAERLYTKIKAPFSQTLRILIPVDLQQ